MPAGSSSARFRFGVYELDAARGELRRSGLEVHLQAQPLRLLGLLVARAGETVSREEIRRHIWPTGTHVEFDQGINAAMKQVRAALRDDPDSPRFVQTVPRAGYRFVADVEPIADGACPAVACAGRREARGRLRLAAGAGLSLLALAALAVARPWTGRTDAEPSPAVLAVLPFELFGDGAEDAFFSDALTEELIAQLGRQYGARLSVIARTSVMKYKDTDKGIGEIARELGADYVLEGSVRRVDERLRIVAQLIRAADASHVWSSAFQRESDDLLALQVELGETISRGLALKLIPGVASQSGATSPEVYETYLRGRHLLRAEQFQGARPVLERAVALDPGFAPAWAALGGLYRFLPPGEGGGIGPARDAIARALALDGELPEAHFLLAMIRLYKEYDVEGARRAFERAIELNPGYAEAHHNFAAYFSVTGRHDEAVASVQRARRVDPLSSMINSDVGWYYYFGRRYREAIEHSERTLRLDPDFYWAKLCIQLARHQLADSAAAREQAREEMRQAGADRELLERLSAPDPATALHSYWRWRLERMTERRRASFVPPDAFAQVHMVLGDHEQALDALETAFETRTGWILPFLRVDPLFDPLRENPRFRDLLARIASAGTG